MGFSWTGFGTGFFGGIADTQEANDKERRFMRRQMADHAMRLAEQYQDEKLKAAKEVEQADAVGKLYGWNTDRALTYIRLPETERKKIEDRFFLEAGTPAGTTPTATADGLYNPERASQMTSNVSPAAKQMIDAETSQDTFNQIQGTVTKPKTPEAAVQTPGLTDDRNFMEKILGKPSFAQLRTETAKTLQSTYGYSSEEVSRAMQGRAGVERKQPSGDFVTGLQRKPEGYSTVLDFMHKSVGDVDPDKRPEFMKAIQVYSSPNSTAEQRDDAVRTAASLAPGFNDKLSAKFSQMMQIEAAKMQGALQRTIITGQSRVDAANAAAGNRTPQQIGGVLDDVQSWLKDQFKAPILKFGSKTVTLANPNDRAQITQGANYRASELAHAGYDAATIRNLLSKEITGGEFMFGYKPDVQRFNYPNNQPQSNTIAPSSSGSLPPLEALNSLKEGQDTTFGNGEVWTLKNGIPLRIK